MARRLKVRTADVDNLCISLAKANDRLAAATARAERAEAAEADLRATVERVRALATHECDRWCIPFDCQLDEAAKKLAAALDGPTDTEGADRRPGWLARLEAESRQHAAELGETDEEYADG